MPGPAERPRCPGLDGLQSPHANQGHLRSKVTEQEERETGTGSSCSCTGTCHERRATSRWPFRHRRGRLNLSSMSVGVAIVALSIGGVLAQEDTTDDGDSSSGGGSVGTTILSYVTIGVLIAASGLFSGLTLGLLGLDKIGLEIIGNGDEPRMAAFAKKIQPVRADGNLLLCTLLLGNVAVNALLSIVMAQLTSGLVGFALATAIITVFGEIIPQAVCSRHALRIGSTVVPLVRVIILILYPITKPLSLMLDKMLGDEIGTIHSRTELNELLKIHVEHGAIDVETGREVAGAMNYKEHMVREVMTPVKECFMLSVDEKLNFKTLSVIFKSGFSRIPVFGKDHNDVIGLLFTKDLIFIDPDDETPLKNFVQIFGRAVTVVWPDYTLGDVLKIFKQGKSHLSLVRDVNDSGEGDPFYEIIGIITLEDIIEEILGDEIVDETDMFVDVETQLPVQRCEFDMSRLQLLNANAGKSSLSADETKAIVSHLVANVPQFKGAAVEHVESAIATSPVVDITKEMKIPKAEPGPAEVLYRRGRTSTMCTLILTGKANIIAGKDGFQSDAGPWSVLAADALVEDEGMYRPDFSAYAGSEHLRCLRISKASFDTITSLSRQEDDAASEIDLEHKPEGGGGNGDTSGVASSTSLSGRGTRSNGKPRLYSDVSQRSFSPGSGVERGVGRISPGRGRRGLPTSVASLKILQAVSGSSVVSGHNPAPVSPEARIEQGNTQSAGLPVGGDGDCESK